MPELPEARTIARRLNEAIAGSTIETVSLHRGDMLKLGHVDQLAAMAGQRFQRVDTRGKYVLLHWPGGRLVVQLGMSGRLMIVPGNQPIVPHTHLVIRLTDGREVRYSNVRRIASGLHILPPGRADVGPLAGLGVDAPEMSLAQFAAALSGTARAIKGVLLDQARLAGVGNIYSDEALARAGIRPTRHADRLSADQVARLYQAVLDVLRDAIAAGGSSLNDATPFVDADGQLGYFAAHHRVYGRYGQPCKACGQPLRRATIAGRTSTYCPRCQK